MTKLVKSASLLADGVAHPGHGVAVVAQRLAEFVRGRRPSHAGAPTPGCGDDLQWLSLSTEQQDLASTDRGICDFALLQLDDGQYGALPGTDRYM